MEGLTERAKNGEMSFDVKRSRMNCSLGFFFLSFLYIHDQNKAADVLGATGMGHALSWDCHPLGGLQVLARRFGNR